jgi:F-type H+-transporting ATPase subunit gamma
MANLKEIRIRLNSVKSTRQITSAMKMVSAAKLRKAQDAILQMRPFASQLQNIYRSASAAYNDSAENVFLKPGLTGRVLLIVIASNRGLCGAFNSNVIKRTIARINEKYTAEFQENKVDILSIGKKGHDGLKARRLPIVATNHSILEKVSFDEAGKMADSFIEGFLKKEYCNVEIIYNQFRNAAVQDVVLETFLPVNLTVSTDAPAKEPLNYIFEPSAELLLERLIPMLLRIRFHKALLDSQASEHGARMTAMHKATDNATEFIRDLELTYNKARQASITKELLEIVSGANALKG